MDKEKKYYKSLDIVRLLSCIAVFLYHLNILKGGYLAVCTFFVLTGYLSCLSSFRKEKFSILKYYKDRIVHIYLPFLIVVFISIFLVSTLTTFNWINLKPETTSVILGYNNYWQINASIDYFARFITSPFMHFWYMGILLQFELVFPFVFIILKFIGNKLHRLIPCLLLIVSSILFLFYFYVSGMTESIMTTYYGTFSRLFSILFGVTIGFIYHYYRNYLPKFLDKKIINRLIIILYLVALTALFILVRSTSSYFSIAMILTTFITCRLIKYGTRIENENVTFLDKIINSLADVSYEVYLVQYPVIFIFKYINFKNIYLDNTMIILITFVISYVLHFSLNYKKNKNNKIRFLVLRILVLLGLFATSYFGVDKYIKSKDYTKDAQALQDKLKENEKLMKEKQKEYELNLKEENDSWEKVLNDLNAGEEKIKKTVSKLSVVGIGDSVILDAIPYLYEYFPNGYFDAKQSRTDYEADDIIVDLLKKNKLGNPIVIGLGTNGQCGPRCHKEIVRLCGKRKIFWINVTNDDEVHVNDSIAQLAKENKNVYLIDWNKISKGYDDYFIYDGVHLKTKGQKAYAKAIYDSIYKTYLEEYRKKKNDVIKKHNEELKTKLSFYGNELLLNILEYIKDDYKDIKFGIDKDYNKDSLLDDLKDDKENKTLTHRLVFVFDDKVNMKDNDYKELIELYKDHEITFIIYSKKDIKLENENVKIINLYETINSNDKYLIYDKKHISKDGYNYIKDLILKEIKL